MNVPLYYGGNHLGRVSPIPADSFEAFVNYICANIKHLPITRKEYSNLSRSEQGIAKRTKYFTPCSFKSAGQRVTERAIVCNLITIDVDDFADSRALIEGRRNVAHQLEGRAHIIFSTASSTHAQPRVRVVVSANAIPISSYPAAVRNVAAKLGVRNVTPESLIPVQPMYLPVSFAGEDLL